MSNRSYRARGKTCQWTPDSGSKVQTIPLLLSSEIPSDTPTGSHWAHVLESLNTPSLLFWGFIPRSRTVHETRPPLPFRRMRSREAGRGREYRERREKDGVSLSIFCLKGKGFHPVPVILRRGVLVGTLNLSSDREKEEPLGVRSPQDGRRTLHSLCLPLRYLLSLSTQNDPNGSERVVIQCQKTGQCKDVQTGTKVGRIHIFLCQKGPGN